MRFTYRGISSAGENIGGEIDAQNRKQAIQSLAKNGIRIIFFEETRSVFFEKFLFWKREKRNFECKLCSEEMCVFFEKLERLIRGGLTLSDALNSIAQHTFSKKESALSKCVLTELQDGMCFHKALQKACNSFNVSVLSILSAGDSTGNIAHALLDVIKLLRRKIDAKKRFIAGISYPLFICGLAFGVMFLFLFYLMPKIESMMRSLGGNLPTTARMLVSCSTMVVRYSPIVMMLGGIAAIFVINCYKNQKFKLFFDEKILKIPVLGSLNLLVTRVGIFNVLSSLLSSGVNASDSVFMAMEAIGNEYLRKQYLCAYELIVEGGSISIAFEKFNIIGGSFCDILSVGEKTGDLVIAFSDIADLYDEQLNVFFKKLVIITSSIALIFAFSLVAILALSIVSSVLNFSKSLVLTTR